MKFEKLINAMTDAKMAKKGKKKGKPKGNPFAKGKEKY